MELKNLPKLNFAEADPDIIDSNIVTTVEALLGRKLARADPLRIFLRGIEAIIIQQRILIDEAAKQNLLAYATGANLDHIGVLTGTERLQASAATTTLQFTLSNAREMATVIPKGTRATAGDGRLFALDEPLVITAGEESATGKATCTQVGEKGNNYAAGELKQLADPVPFIASVTNVTKTEGGADIEDDDTYRERIHEAPERFSTAGPYGAYEYHAKRASALVCDVSVESPAPGEVVVCPLLDGGVIPGQEILAIVNDTLNDRRIRPLTDKVTVKAPEQVSYNIKLSYWINRDDTTEALTIKTATEQAVQEFVLWQKSKLGRDINQTELYYRLRAAGVKRAEITEPISRTILPSQVAIAQTIDVIFEGLEDD